MKRVAVRVAAIVALVAALTSVNVRTAPFDFSYTAMFVFGDSLSDTGNDWLLTNAAGFSPAIPPSQTPHRTYYEGRFSNGPILFEYLCQRIGLCEAPVIPPSLASLRVPRTGATSFGFGGSGSGIVSITPGDFPVPGLLGQVELFRLGLGGRRAPEGALYTIFTGTNDYSTNPAVPSRDPADVVADIERAIRTLYATGAREVVVMSLPTPTIFPSFTLGLVSPEAAADLIARTAQHNALLAARLAVLRGQLKRLQLIAVDGDLAVQSVLPTFSIAPPATFFLPSHDPTIPAFACLFVLPAACADVPLTNEGRALFWDLVHPTTEAQAAFAAYLETVLRAYHDDH